MILIIFQLVCFLTLTFGHPITFTNVTNLKTKIVCSETQFSCYDIDMTCIPFKQRCDGQIHCPSTGADEYHCEKRNLKLQSNFKLNNLNLTSFLVIIYTFEQFLMFFIVLTFLLFIHKM